MCLQWERGRWGGSCLLTASCGFTHAPLLTLSTQGLVPFLQSPGLGWEEISHKQLVASFLLNVCLVAVISLGVVKKIQRNFAGMHATISYFRKRHLDTFGIFVSYKALLRKYKTKTLKIVVFVCFFLGFFAFFKWQDLTVLPWQVTHVVLCSLGYSSSSCRPG